MPNLTGHRGVGPCRSIRKVRSTLQSERSPAVRMICKREIKHGVSTRALGNEGIVTFATFMAEKRETYAICLKSQAPKELITDGSRKFIFRCV